MAIDVGRVATVHFPDSEKDYDYVVPEGLKDLVIEGSKVVVESPFSGYQVVDVVEIRGRLESEWEGDFKPIVDIVDDSEYVRGKENARQVETLRRELTRRLEKVQEMRVFEELAKGDPVAETILSTLKELEA